MPITQDRMITLLQSYDQLKLEFETAIYQTKARYQIMAEGPNGSNLVELEQILMDLWAFKPHEAVDVYVEKRHFQRYAKANQSATRRAKELRQTRGQSSQATSPLANHQEYGLTPTSSPLPRRREREPTSKYIYHQVRPQEPSETPDDAPRLDLESIHSPTTKVPTKPNLREAALDADIILADLFGLSDEEPKH